jgi:hypothetical protein
MLCQNHARQRRLPLKSEEVQAAAAALPAPLTPLRIRRDLCSVLLSGERGSDAEKGGRVVDALIRIGEPEKDNLQNTERVVGNCQGIAAWGDEASVQGSRFALVASRCA